MTAREVELSGGAPWGFRMHGGADHNQPLRISRSLSDTPYPYRTFDVNPGRKASLCGIREGDVISSINGRTTRSMSNADAHAMLRSAGPVLRLGLNEDREMSPRRRSIGKGSELKRPSQLIADTQTGRAIPQPPVYATIRPSQSPHRPSPSIRSSLNSLPAALNSTPLVRSVAGEEPPRFHPTNPFYTTLPSNYSSASKLPVPNGRPSFSTLDRNKPKDSFSDYSADLKSPSFFTRTDTEPASLPHSTYNGVESNGYEPLQKTSNDLSYSRKFDLYNKSLPDDDKIKNPFDTKRNSDPFEKYFRSENKMNGAYEHDAKTMPSSMSDGNFRSNEKTTQSSTITEHKISEVEEVKTIKKIIFNGREGSSESNELKSPESDRKKDYTSHETKEFYSCQQSPRRESAPITPSQQRNEPFSTSFDQKEKEGRNFTSGTSRQSTQKGYIGQYTAETPTEVVTEKPPLKASTQTSAVQSPTQRRK